jgi:hypothetical protein
MCGIDWASISNYSLPEAEDNEDLVAVMHESTEDMIAGWTKYKRSRMDTVAAMLPSSHSRKLDGRVATRDVQVFLAWVLSGDGTRKDPDGYMEVAVDAVRSAFVEQGDTYTRLDNFWQPFGTASGLSSGRAFSALMLARYSFSSS